MIDLKKLQKKVYQNKLDKGFNTTDICKEFCLIHEEIAEAFRAYNSQLPDLGEELADILIYLLGLSEILDIDLEAELLAKIEKNEQRQYQRENGVLKEITRQEDSG